MNITGKNRNVYHKNRNQGGKRQRQQHQMEKAAPATLKVRITRNNSRLGKLLQLHQRIEE